MACAPMRLKLAAPGDFAVGVMTVDLLNPGRSSRECNRPGCAAFAGR